MKALADGIPKYKYLFDAVSNCIRAYKNGDKKSPYQTDDVEFAGLLQQEKDLFFPDVKFLKMPFSMARNNKAIKALSICYAHYTWNDRDEYQTILQVIELGLNEHDYAELKPFFTLLQYLLTKPNTSDKSDNRFERTMTFFLETLERNQIYYKFMESSFEFIFKLLGAVPHIFTWF